MRVKINLGGAPVQAVCAPEDGRMPWKVDDATLTDCNFVIIAEGREKFLRGHNNMHAWISGEIQDDVVTPWGDEWQRVRYNPHKHSCFIDLDGRPVKHAEMVTLRVFRGKAKTYARGITYADEESDQG